MSPFRNINGPNLLNRCQGRVRCSIALNLFVIAIAMPWGRTSYSQIQPGGGTAVRVDEKGRKFVNKIPFDVFFDNPLAIVNDNRNAIAPSETPQAPATESKKTAEAAPANSKSEGLFWKDLIPIEELQSEVKLIRNSLTKATTNQASYKSNFQQIAQEGAEMAALAGILQAHTESLSWKDKSHYARDFAAQIHQSATGLTKENFDNTKSAFLKLTAILEGSIPNDAGDVPQTRPFNESAPRKGLMKRIETAKNFLQKDVNSEAKFKSLADQARREAAIVSALGTVITTPGYEYTSEVDYQKHAQSLIEGGKEAASALQDDAYDRFQKAVDKINKSCTDCHQSYGTQ